MRYSLFLILVALTASAISGIAHTQTASVAPVQPRYVATFDAKFRAADTDGDDALTREEARAAGLGNIADNFDRLDTNKDGKLTRDEIRALLRNRLSS